MENGLQTLMQDGSVPEINSAEINETTYQGFGYYKNDDVPDVIDFLTDDTYQVYIPGLSNLTSFAGPDWSYNPATGVITYNGDSGVKTVIGSVSLGSAPNPNRLIHFAFAVNDVIQLECSAKLESTTGILSIGFNAPVQINNGDECTIQAKADVAGEYNALHGQGEIK